MNPHHKTEDDLQTELQQINAAKADAAAFGPLYDKYYKSIFVFVYRRTGSEDLAADIVSQVFLVAMVHLKKYEYRGVPFSAWLFRIAFNEVNSHFRKSSKRERVISLEEEHLKTITEELKETDSAEKERAVMLALGELKEESMQLIEFRFFEKRAFSEIGNILGITENNAKAKVYRVLEAIRQIMKTDKKLK